MVKLIAGIMGQDCMRFLPMCLESLKSAEKIIYIDGGSKDGSIEFAKEKGAEVIINPYDQEDRGMNGRQRNRFLSYVKEKYPRIPHIVLVSGYAEVSAKEVKELGGIDLLAKPQDIDYLIQLIQKHCNCN